MDFYEMKYHQAMVEFSRGDPKMTVIWPHGNDVSPADGIGGVTRSFKRGTKNIGVAASPFKEGLFSFDTLEKYTTEDLGYEARSQVGVNNEPR